mmetsp:Transcript_11007/g.23532  ORF Transcript_11007/g.23532 Transcript_11007/m.23532 type:complete len:95 (+) Transcript_11007:728-1012(+)
MVQKMEIFSFSAAFFRKDMIAAAAAASRPEVGSSRKTTRGFLHRATASESRRFWPPDKPFTNWFPALVCWQLVRPISSIRLSIASSRSDVDRFA